jgi:CNT family concentrative nucleoside transporter
MLAVLDFLVRDNHYMSMIGIAALIGVAFLFSNNKRKINLKQIFVAFAMQLVFAFFILNTTIGVSAFQWASSGIETLYKFAGNGTDFVFGALANPMGPWGFVFVIKVLPVIIFFAALTALLYHLGIVQIIVKGIAFVIRPVLGTSGAETLCVVASSMLGQTEAPLLIKNYMPRMTNSEMLLIMVSGMAHLSGSILAVYGMMGVPLVHLMSSSVIAIPGAILIAKILVPEDGVPETLGAKSVQTPRETSNVLDAISTGTSDGLKLAVNVAAMLKAFISLTALVD